MSPVNVDTLMHDAGARWRAAQSTGPGYDVSALVSVERPPGPRRLTVLVAALAVASVIVAVFVAVQPLRSTAGHRQPAAPGTTAAPLTSGQLVGAWYSSVSPAEARQTYRALVGGWTLTLLADGTVRVTGPSSEDGAAGHWQLSSDATMTLELPFRGCSTDVSRYLATITPLHGLLEFVAVDGQESCESRSLVVGGHWSFSANAAG